jgi:putative ABC transport system substrate-binding protein
MSHSSRRRFLRGGRAMAGLGLLAGCGVIPLRSREQARVPRVGVLFPFSLPAQGFSQPFHEGLREVGYVVGENIHVEYRSSDGQAERLPDLAAELAQLPVDVLVTFGGTPAALAAKQATDTVPIVVLLLGDPVGSGLVASYARPGGNVTGITNLAPETSAKRLELLREVVPGLARVDFLWNPANPVALPDWRETQAAARLLGLQVRSVEARSSDEVASALAAIGAERPDAVINTGEVIFGQRRAQVLEFLANNRLPAIHQFTGDVLQGGLMSYGVNTADAWRRAAHYVDKILKGAKPADLPVEQPTKFDFVINLNTAQALGLTIPPSVVAQATEVVQ